MSIKLDGATRLYPIIGTPIIYARSPELLSAQLQRRGFNAICPPVEVPAGTLGEVMQALSLCPNIDGLLITMPHKQAILPLCQSLSETSQLLGAASCIRRTAEGGWHGDTLDGESFVDAQIKAGAKVEGAKALLIGAGGAGSAIAISLLARGVAELAIYDLNQDRAAALVAMLAPKAPGRVRLGQPDPRGFDILSHATNMGMSATDPLPVDVTLLGASTLVGDVIAGHGETALIAAAKAVGCKTANGDQMVTAVLDMMTDFLVGLR